MEYRLTLAVKISTLTSTYLYSLCFYTFLLPTYNADIKFNKYTAEF
jgi:hypothetical protein